jgi:hypothetical protein
MDTALFNNDGISVEWMDYSHYPEYDQLHGEFEHAVSIIDLLVSMGKSAGKYLGMDK